MAGVITSRETQNDASSNNQHNENSGCALGTTPNQSTLKTVNRQRMGISDFRLAKDNTPVSMPRRTAQLQRGPLGPRFFRPCCDRLR